jgi:hypothetical protein
MMINIPTTPHETAVMTRLNAELRAAGYPTEYAVHRDVVETIEGYYKRIEAAERLAGSAAWFTWTRTGKPCSTATSN